MNAPTINQRPGLYTHKEVFTRYLREAPRWTADRGGSKIQPWREWIRDEGMDRCDVTGFYGAYGTDVTRINGDSDMIVVNDERLILYAEAIENGYEVEWIDTDYAGEIIRLSQNGRTIMDFCDTHVSKERRAEIYINR